ncbi:MAG: DUF4402 domain-containing protein [Bacteroidota bacterium]|nr:DUF4402 domain-containing protein [Bacteroidota bacterium]
MKKYLLSIFAVCIGLPTAIFAANEVTATSKVNAEIVNLVTVSKSVDMNFGRIAPGSISGSCELAVDGTRIFNNAYAGPGGATPAAARFDVGGTPGTTYTVALPASAAVYLNDNASGESMTVNAFKLKLESKDAGVLAGVTGTDAYFNVGATLSVAANQSVGAYTGSFTVTVTYQ